MTVLELTKILLDCHDDAEVFIDDVAVNSVYELGVRENEYQPWCVKRVILTSNEDPWERSK